MNQTQHKILKTSLKLFNKHGVDGVSIRDIAGKLNISVGNKTIILTDLNGKILKSFTTDQKVISLSDIAVGQYFLTILNNKNEKLTTQIVMKQQ